MNEAERRAAYNRAYHAAHPNKPRTRHANRRAQMYGAPGILTVEEVEQAMSAGRCFYCGATENLSLDHVIPLNVGGANRPENLVCACRFCNISKFRSDRPRRWALGYDRCIECGTTEKRHCCHGRCITCESRRANWRRRGLPKRRSEAA